MTTPDQHAAQRRVQELQAVRAELLRDADDPRVLSELTSIEHTLAAAERELHSTPT